MLLCPRRYCPRGVTELSPADLRAAGLEAVLLDLDNTLVPWKGTLLTNEVREWVRGLHEVGLKLYLVSNARMGPRLTTLSKELDVPFVRRAWKPRRKGFEYAMARLGVDPAHTAMVGDQMFTDVLGGNRLGLYTVMVPPIARREFLGTKVSRLFECVVLRWLKGRGHLA